MIDRPTHIEAITKVNTKKCLIRYYKFFVLTCGTYLSFHFNNIVRILFRITGTKPEHHLTGLAIKFELNTYNL